MTQQRSFMSVLGNVLGTNTKKESMTTYTQEQINNFAKGLTESVMELVELLGHNPVAAKQIDTRAWEHLMVYAPLAAPSTSPELTMEQMQRIFDRYGGDMLNCTRAIERHGKAAPSTSQAESREDERDLVALQHLSSASMGTNDMYLAGYAAGKLAAPSTSLAVLAALEKALPEIDCSTHSGDAAWEAVHAAINVIKGGE